jgi:predicted transcriptional regulator
MELKRRPMLKEVLEAVGSGKRLAALEQITQGTPAKEIHENIDASRSGVQHFVNDFKDTELITDPEDGQYELTAKGELVTDLLTDLDEEFKAFERERFRSLASESSMSVEEMKEMLEEVEGEPES